MNKEIKFRGKRINRNNEWAYGDLRIIPEQVLILPQSSYDAAIDRDTVNPDTVGQYTGLHDKNGKEIYEGDIVTILRTPKHRQKSVLTRHIVTSYSVIRWTFKSLAEEVLSLCMEGHNERDSYRFEVIGNIYDNPELAKPYSLNLPAPKQRKKRNKGIIVEFVVSDNPKPEPHVEDNKLIYEVTQEEMNEAIRSQLKESNKQ